MNVKKQIQIIRLTAKILLVLVVAVLVSGFLTAKPALWSAEGFSSYRWVHTSLLPLVFVPVLFVHAGAGILLMLGRSKRFDRPHVRRLALGLWAAVGVAFAVLYVVEPAEPDLAVLELSAQGGAPPAPAEAGGGGGDPTEQVAAGGQGGRAGAVAAAGAPAEDAREPAPSSLPTTVSTPRRPSPTTPATAAPATKPSATAAAAALTGPQLIQQRCVGCHGLDVVVAKKRTTTEWSAVVDRMIGHGAQLTADERRLVMRYLPRK